MTVLPSRNCIVRLSRYKNALHRFRTLGFIKVFSDTLAEEVGVTSSQVRKDFSLFGISGKKRGGYDLDELIEKLNNIFGKDRLEKVVVIGCGNIGRALINYKGFEREGIKITACFDIDPAKCKKEAAVPVLAMEDLCAYVNENGIKIGIIAVPDIAARQVMGSMVSAGIKGILNFAPLELKAPGGTVINNVNLGLELENLIYFVNSVSD